MTPLRASCLFRATIIRIYQASENLPTGALIW
jgi:hypothetical protein